MPFLFSTFFTEQFFFLSKLLGYSLSSMFCNVQVIIPGAAISSFILVGIQLVLLISNSSPSLLEIFFLCYVFCKFLPFIFSVLFLELSLVELQAFYIDPPPIISSFLSISHLSVVLPE